MFDPNNAPTFNHATSLTLFDSLGATHTATMYFVKTATPNQWNARFYIDGTAVGGAQTLKYSNTGALTAPAAGEFALPAYTPTTGAAPITVGQRPDLDAVRRHVRGQRGDAGRLHDRPPDRHRHRHTGIVQARFTNGRSQPLGQIALANFANPQGLQQLGNTPWAETFASGQALRGQAGNSRFGLCSPARSRRRTSTDRAARQHDHRAAQLPGERADDHHRRFDHADHHQHALTLTH